MSAGHSVKCTREEADAFRDKVKSFLDSKKLPYVKIIGLRCYDGQVKVFTGDTMIRWRLRHGLKLVAFKKPDGSYEGEADAIQDLKTKGGDSIYLKTSEPISEKEYFPIYRTDNWKAEKEYLREKLRKAGEK